MLWTSPFRFLKSGAPRSYRDCDVKLVILITLGRDPRSKVGDTVVPECGTGWQRVAWQGETTIRGLCRIVDEIGLLTKPDYTQNP